MLWRALFILLSGILTLVASGESIRLDRQHPSHEWPLTGLGEAAILRIRWQAPADGADAWLSAFLTTSDDLHYTSARSYPLRGNDGEIIIPARAAHWAGESGLFDGDVLAGVSAFGLRLDASGPEPITVTCSWETVASRAASQPRLRLRQLLQLPQWQELHFDLLGIEAQASPRLLLADGRSLPAFWHQTGDWRDGRWLPRGPAHWTVRLRPDERSAGSRLQLNDWQSPPLPELLADEGRPVSGDAGPLAAPRSTLSWRLATRHQGAAVPALIEHAQPRELDCLAPQLIWQQAWTGYRGRHLPSHAAGASLDSQLPTARVIDLLPQHLFEEHGTYRFGLTPWHRSAGGPWSSPALVWRDATSLAELRAHAAAVLARSRAAPALQHYLLSCRLPAGNAAERQALHGLIAEIAALVARDDGRPLLVLHPQEVPYLKTDPVDQPWISFEDGAVDWRRIDLLAEAGPWQRSQVPLTSRIQATHGRYSLALQLPIDADRLDAQAAAVMALDTNLFGMHRLEFDLQLRGNGLASVYCFLTDAEHRWYQQRVAVVQAGEHWQTLGVDCSDHAPWQAIGHKKAWNAGSKQRIRSLGFAIYHSRPATSRPVATTGYIDNVRRFGWPTLAEEPQLQISALSGPQTTSLDSPCHWRFGLNQHSRNPYDPVEVQVDAAFTAPGGEVIQRPAFFYEDADGSSGWEVRFSPPQLGTWRWHVQARLHFQDEYLHAETAPQDLTVTAATAARLPPIEAAKDPRWWQTADGEFFYPLGINLRSPGDERQDALLRGAGVAVRSHDYEKRGLGAYEDWFAKMQAQNMNYARVWMCPWWCGLEWTREWNGFGGLTWYNQQNAATLDRICELAAAHRIYLQIELQNHGMTSPHVDSQWEESPYRLQNGGLAADSADFFTDENCWQTLTKRHRYVNARWGHLSHILAWVLTSEAEFTGSWYRTAYRRGYDDREAHDPATEAWVRRNLAWWKEHDYRQRPVSIHFSHPWRGKHIWLIDGLGFNNSNVYTGFQTAMGKLGGRDAGLGSGFHYYLNEYFPPTTLGRPSMLGEWGGHWAETDPQKLAAELHCGLWLQSVLPFGGNVGFWWWLWVDASESWSAYGKISRFIAGTDPRGQNYTPARPPISDGRTPVWAYGSSGRDQHRYYVWLRGLDRTLELTGGEAGTMQVAIGDPGSDWRVERWNCQTGRLADSRVYRADDAGQLRVPLGRIDPDAAFKIDRVKQ